MVRRCIAVDPSDRYVNWQQVIDALRALRSARSRPLARALAGVMALVLAIGGGAFAARALGGDAAIRTAEPSGPRFATSLATYATRGARLAEFPAAAVAIERGDLLAMAQHLPPAIERLEKEERFTEAAIGQLELADALRELGRMQLSRTAVGRARQLSARAQDKFLVAYLFYRDAADFNDPFKWERNKQEALDTADGIYQELGAPESLRLMRLTAHMIFDPNPYRSQESLVYARDLMAELARQYAGGALMLPTQELILPGIAASIAFALDEPAQAQQWLGWQIELERDRNLVVPLHPLAVALRQIGQAEACAETDPSRAQALLATAVPTIARYTDRGQPYFVARGLQMKLALPTWSFEERQAQATRLFADANAPGFSTEERALAALSVAVYLEKNPEGKPFAELAVADYTALAMPYEATMALGALARHSFGKPELRVAILRALDIMTAADAAPEVMATLQQLLEMHDAFVKGRQDAQAARAP